MLTLFFASLIIVGIAIAAFAVRMFFIKGATFKKECSCGKNEQGSSCSSSCETPDFDNKFK